MKKSRLALGLITILTLAVLVLPILSTVSAQVTNTTLPPLPSEEEANNMKIPPEDPNPDTSNFYQDALNIPTSEPKNTDNKNKNVIVLASVNVWNAQIVNQDRMDIKVSFEINNQKDAQPGIKCGIQLIKKETNLDFVVDEWVNDEVFDLSADTTINKTLDYHAPDYLNGEYVVKVVCKNERGLPLGHDNAGKIKLEGSGEYVNLPVGTCFLKIQGEEGNKKYAPDQGVDVKSDETLIATCEAINNFKSEQTITPYVETYHRSIFGKKLGEKSLESLTFPPGENKTITFEIPKAEDPQAYDAMLTFRNNDGKTVSNRIRFHYVIHGLSATIQNLRLDKDYYQKGETAKATFNWTPSADTFFGARMNGSEAKKIFLEVAVNNKDGQTCGSGKKESDASPKSIDNVEISIPISQNCPDPQAKVRIMDENGKVLDAMTFNIKSQNAPPSVPAPALTNNPDKVKRYGILAIVILFLLSLSLIIIKKRNGGIRLLFFFMLLFLGFTVSVRDSSAMTVYVPAGGSHMVADAVYDISLNKGTYSPGEGMLAKVDIISHAGCLNGGLLFAHAGARNIPTGEQAPMYNYFVWTDWMGNYWNMRVMDNWSFWMACGWGCPQVWFYSQDTSAIQTTASRWYTAPGPGWYPDQFEFRLGSLGAQDVPPPLNTIWGTNYMGLLSLNNFYHLSYSVVQPPSVWLSANPGTINQGNGSTLSWSSNNGPTWCWLDWIGWVPGSGSAWVTPGTTTTFGLTCGNAGGQNTAWATVNVIPYPPVAITFNSDKANICAGHESANLSWNVSNTRGSNPCTLNGVWVGSSGNQAVSPGVATNYTLTCYNMNDIPASQTIPISMAPITYTNHNCVTPPINCSGKCRQTETSQARCDATANCKALTWAATLTPADCESAPTPSHCTNGSEYCMDGCEDNWQEVKP